MGSNIAIVGAGAYGTALACVLSENDHQIRLHVRETDAYRAIVGWQTNPHFLPRVSLNLERIHPATNWAEVVRGMEFVFLTVPAQYLKEVITAIRPYLDPDAVIILTSKGMVENGTTMSEIASQELPDNELCGLYGITFAEHIALNNNDGFSTMCIAAPQKRVHDKVANLFMQRTSNRFRIYTSNDLRGVEFGGAMKNVYAISMGIIDGFYGENDKISRYSFMPLCMSEFVEFGILHGSNLYTLLGPSGIGDICACCNNTSRNYRYGTWIASVELCKCVEAKKPPALHEGYDTLHAAMQLADNYKLEAPILKATHDILFRSRKIKSIIPKLLKHLSGVIPDTEEAKFGGMIASTINKSMPVAPKLDKSHKIAFLSYRFTQEYEQYVDIIRATSELYGIRITTGVAEGPQPAKRGISDIVIDKIKKADFYFAIYLNIDSDSSWMNEERAIAIDNNKEILILVENGTPMKNLGKLNGDMPRCEFTRDSFIEVLNKHLLIIGKSSDALERL